ncbi:hypothetical protein EXN66_Car021080 [Channa argus]|uniref:Uncharacterized protein n=1 Tax=Channa argus TaxID=215402 RepID=A0A6G1QSU1_CHAAH|nr:hypothetical protein EXN66_Car021080 [Channa argus]
MIKQFKYWEIKQPKRERPKVHLIQRQMQQLFKILGNLTHTKLFKLRSSVFLPCRPSLSSVKSADVLPKSPKGFNRRFELTSALIDVLRLVLLSQLINNSGHFYSAFIFVCWMQN